MSYHGNVPESYYYIKSQNIVSIVLYVLIKDIYLYICIERELEVNQWVDISYFRCGAKGG